MKTQLVLIDDSPRDWRMDEHTREVGRAGIAAARAVLRSSRATGDELAEVTLLPAPIGSSGAGAGPQPATAPRRRRTAA